MKLTGIVWLRDVVDKLLWKHNVTIETLVISAREMTKKEKKSYGKNK